MGPFAVRPLSMTALKADAAPVDEVQEIFDMRPLARLPQAPEILLGMINVRGRGILVVDLRLTLGLPTAPDTENTRIIVLTLADRATDLRFGLRADGVFEVTILDEDGLDPPPVVSGTWAGHCIAGIGRRSGRFVTVLDLERLLGAFDHPSRAA